jgi:uncharacterized protein with FMN-binding domain
MKRAVLAIVSTVASLVLLLSFKTHSLAVSASPPAAVSTTGTPDSSGSAGTSSGATATTAKKDKTAAKKTFTGAAAQTRYGPVQVRIAVKKGEVANVAAIQYPTSDPRDAEINSFAIPALDSEATAAASTNITMISGATYTSEGYLSSLQSALDQAGL